LAGRAASRRRGCKDHLPGAYWKYAEREYPTPPTSKIAEFVAILVKRWPDDTGEAFDESPWAAAPLIREASRPFMYFAMNYSRADEAAPFAAATAAQLGLVCFDPQEGASGTEGLNLRPVSIL
jgi:hypothetical protein